MIKFKNSDDKDIGEKIPFSVVDEKRQFYLTDLIDTPKEIFKISVSIYNHIITIFQNTTYITIIH